MNNKIEIITTGLVPVVTIADLGNLTLTHPKTEEVQDFITLERLLGLSSVLTELSNNSINIRVGTNIITNLTDVERLNLIDLLSTKVDTTAISNVVNVDTTTTANINSSLDKRFVTDSDLELLSSLESNLDAKQDVLGYIPEDTNNKNISNGYCGLDSTGKVAAAQLPSYVDDVLEYASLAAFPAIGESNKIYVDISTNNTYRWSGTVYILVGNSERLNYEELSLTAGIINGGIISGLTGETTFAISDGEGVVVEYTNPSDPIVTKFSWTGLIDIPITNINTATVTYVYINKLGVVIQETTEPTNSSRRGDRIYLGQIGHQNLLSIGNVVSIPDVANVPISQLRDLWSSLGGFFHGNKITPVGGNLQLNKSSGTYEKYGVNQLNNPLDPNVIQLPAQTPITFRYRTQIGQGFNNLNSINPLVWDNAGIITELTGTKATNQRVYINSVGSVVIQYGQTVYNSLAAAIASANSEPFNLFINLESFILIAVISVSSDCIDLANTNKARILKVDDRGKMVFTDSTPLAIKQGATSITPTASSLTFTGNGVSVSASGDDVTVTITGEVGSNNISTDPRAGVYTLLQDLLITTTPQIIPFDTNDILCPGIAHSTTTNTGRFVASIGGQYSFTLQPQTFSTSNIAGTVKLWVRKNGLDITNSAIIIGASSTSETTIDPIIFPVELDVNEYVEFVIVASVNGKYLLEYQAANTIFSPSPAVPAVILEVKPNILGVLPAGSNLAMGSGGSIQYNTDGLLAGDSNLTWANDTLSIAGGSINLTTGVGITNPSAGLKLYSDKMGGKDLLHVRKQLGAPEALQRALFDKSWWMWVNTGVAAGLWLNTSGTSSSGFSYPFLAVTNNWTKIVRQRYSNGTTGINQTLGIRSNGVLSPTDPFFFSARAGAGNWSNNCRLFIGLSTVAAPAARNVSSINGDSTVGFVVEAADTSQIYFYSCNSNLTAFTKVLTGVTINPNTGFDFYFSTLDNIIYTWQIYDINNKLNFSGQVNVGANAPSSSAFMNIIAHGSNGTNSIANVLQFEVARIYAESDL